MAAKLKLYTAPGIPNPASITFYAAQAGVLDQLEEVHLDVMGGENRQPEYLAKNPAGEHTRSVGVVSSCLDNAFFLCRDG